MKQSEADKDKYKQKYSILKTQIMTQEADKNRMYKQTSAPIEEPLAPISQQMQQDLSPQMKKTVSFTDARKQRKLNKQ